MKRIYSISLLFLYLSFSLGLVVSLHYCGESLASFKLYEKSSCCCDENLGGKPDDCCKDEFKTLKVTTDQIQHEHEFKLHGHDLVFISQNHDVAEYATRNYGSSAFTLSTLPRPPDRSGQVPIYKQIHAFLFYS
ncbi:MAG: hypothetical protein JNJ58_09575 [Chitinophagaceae bacterium]|nr:hypothetical protein [Chitinophagaceae bacterium]